ncbi:hypothetical protein QUB05_25410 [Microcoleus sp. F10-C6]
MGNGFWECDRPFDFFREMLRAIAFFVDRPHLNFTLPEPSLDESQV